MPKFVPRLLVDPRIPTTMPNVAMIDPSKRLAMTLRNQLFLKPVCALEERLVRKKMRLRERLDRDICIKPNPPPSYSGRKLVSYPLKSQPTIVCPTLNANVADKVQHIIYLFHCTVHIPSRWRKQNLNRFEA